MKWLVKNKKKALKHVGCLVIIVLMVSLSGCVSLKKKFTRKKKKGSEIQKFIPVLDPIDYPAKIISSQERYKYHYSLWKIWYKELLGSFVTSRSKMTNDKRQKYFLAQITTQLREMQGWIVDEKKQVELGVIIEELSGLRQDLLKPKMMRNTFSMKKKVEMHVKKINQGFHPRLMDQYITGIDDQ